jgi:peptide/nickel transport system substrate-binding protein
MRKHALSRRALLGAAASSLAAPRLSLAAGNKLLKFIPQADLGVLDPIWTPIYIAGAHGMMVFDTLFGQDSHYQVQPQMAEGHRIEDDGKTHLITLRTGLLWHDGEKVLARDCAASIRRWGARDAFGQSLIAATNEIDAPDDRTVRIRLKHPFPLLTNALAKSGPNICVMMPERLALTDPFKQVTEMVGSGPFRFLAKDRVAGSLVAYERNPAYVPRPNGVADFTAGPKVVHFDRVEWHVLPDSASALAAMQTGEMDWWENPSFDYLPVLRRTETLRVRRLNEFGFMAGMRLNHLYPPFNNVEIRRALFPAIDQESFMTAMATADKQNWRSGVGYFTPNSAMASDASMAALTGKRDLDAARRAIEAAGYKGEKVVVPIASDFPSFVAIGNVGVDLFKSLGFNVEIRSGDWGSLQRGLASAEPADKGGWTAYFAHPSGLDFADPATHYWIRGNGRAAARGWPNSPKLEELRDHFLLAADAGARRKIAEDMQRQAFIDVPYVPLGQGLGSTVHGKDLTGMLIGGNPLFWNVRKA